MTHNSNSSAGSFEFLGALEMWHLQFRLI